MSLKIRQERTPKRMDSGFCCKTDWNDKSSLPEH